MVQPASRAQIQLGDTTVTYLPDGHGWLDPAIFFPASADGGWVTHAAYLDSRGWLPVSVGSFLIRTAGRVVLADLGLGRVSYEIPGTAEFNGGELMNSLAAEGLSASDVDTVVYTHLHHDHVGWTTDVAPGLEPAHDEPTGLTFANARHLVSEAEWHHWANPEFPGPDPVAVQTPLSDRKEFISDGEEIAPGVRVLASPGHTPGHISLAVTDPAKRDKRRLIVLGDVMHCQVQVTESDWAFAFDVDADQARQTRQQLLKELEKENTLLAGGHFAGHVFGRVLPPVARRAWASGDVG